jgi:hypothetical protein
MLEESLKRQKAFRVQGQYEILLRPRRRGGVAPQLLMVDNQNAKEEARGRERERSAINKGRSARKETVRSGTEAQECRSTIITQLKRRKERRSIARARREWEHRHTGLKQDRSAPRRRS